MEDIRFDRPVKILTGRSFSVSRQVETAAQAGDYLLNKWPAGAAGQRHMAAQKACLAALEGVKKARAERLARAAREAFEAAADEAEILVKQSGLPQGHERGR